MKLQTLKGAMGLRCRERFVQVATRGALSFGLLWSRFLACSFGRRSSLPEGCDGQSCKFVDAFERGNQLLPRRVRSHAADLDFQSPAACVDHLIDHRTVDFEARELQITGGLAVELILDAIGGDSLKKGYRLLAPTGRLGMFGVSVISARSLGVDPGGVRLFDSPCELPHCLTAKSRVPPVNRIGDPGYCSSPNFS